jgi:16S rRNA (adenine1518-N6/adenine1519-N6)-dimethyltransferase
MTQEAQFHLLGASDIQQIAASIGVKPTKKLGQNFMIDPGTVRRIARTAGITENQHVVEVGPGLGSLTLALLEAGADVTAVEIDPLLASQLPGTIAAHAPSTASKLHIVVSDALKVTAEQLRSAGDMDATKPFALVSNLPYNVATPILLTFLERFEGMASALVLVQNEVAERLTAAPGSKIYGSPSVKLAWYGTAQKAGMVGRNVFWPVPNVDSSLVAFTRTAATQHQHPAQLRKLTFSIIDAAFAQRRKTLRAALKGTVSAHQIEVAGIDPTLRGEKLTIDDFLAIAEVVAKDTDAPGSFGEGGAE